MRLIIFARRLTPCSFSTGKNILLILAMRFRDYTAKENDRKVFYALIPSS